MSKLSKIQWEELRSYYQRSDKTATGSMECSDCRRSVSMFKLWWHQCSYEYNEWEAFCSSCGLYRIHMYDDIDWEAEFLKGEIAYQTAKYEQAALEAAKQLCCVALVLSPPPA